MTRVSMLALQGHPGYRNTKILKMLRKLQNKRFMRESTRLALYQAEGEIQVLRKRITVLATEVSEWRWKVGGAQYTGFGPEFMGMVDQGIRDRIGSPTGLSDDDFAPWDKEDD